MDEEGDRSGVRDSSDHPWQRAFAPLLTKGYTTLPDKLSMKDTVEFLIQKAAEVLRSRRIGGGAAEQARARRFVGVSFRGPRDQRRAWVPWVGPDVWEIVDGHRQLGSDYSAESGVPQKALDLALDYYKVYPDEIDALLEDNDRPPEEWERLYPGVVSRVSP